MSEKKKWTSTHTDSAIYGDIKSKALAMRRRPTRAENALWQYLRGKRMRGFRFRRQQPIDRFIVDFYCRQAQLVVEVDGPSHHSTEAAEYDEQRTRFLNELGLSLLRLATKR
ncbi:MAG: endonuclease domain-containing protein [Chloroflexota bacterium]|nr:endonuclease domain-containing protein [Chloroflexota bacterium]MDE2949114.1 endonuclease domain-containing protein [Chloroflexota bacterium]